MITAPSAEARHAPWWTHLVVTCAYTLLAVLATYPLVRDLTGALAGNAIDQWLAPWRAWWVARSIGAGTDPFFTQMIYFPSGTSLVFHTLDLPVTGWAPWALSVMSPLTFTNLTVLAALIASALCAYLLALAVTRSVPAACLAGVIYGFTPNRLDQARAHPEIAFGAWMPLALFGAVLLLRAPTLRQRGAAAALAGAALAMALLGREANAVAAAYLLAGLFLLQPVSGVRLGRGAALAWLAALIAVALVIAAPYIVRVARQWPAPPPRAGMDGERQRASVSLESFALPPADSALWGAIGRALGPERTSRRAGRIAFLGVSVIALLAWSTYRSARRPAFWFWALGGLGFAVLSLGPQLLVWERLTGVALPYRQIPFVSLVRAPDRFVPAAVLCVALAIAVSWAAAPPRWLRRERVAVPLLAALLMLDQAMLPFPTTVPAPSAFYATLARDPEPFALLEIPANSEVHDKLYQYYQTLHGKPLQAGHVSRLPPSALATIEGNDTLRALAAAGAGRPALPPRDAAADLRALAAIGFRYLIVHDRARESAVLRPPNADELAILAQLTPWLGGPVYEDQLLRAYDLRRAGAAAVQR